MRQTQTSAVENRSAEAEGRDRRRFVRVRNRTTFEVRQILNDGVGDPVTVVLLDLSGAGIGIMHSQPMRRGDQYQIPLAREAPAGPLALVCTVVRCEELDDGLFSIGMEFNSSRQAVKEGRRQLTGRKA